jgi:hypothetical protein
LVPHNKEARKLKVFENGVLENMLERKMEDVTGEWRKLHEGLHDLYFASNIIRVMR